MLISCLVLAFAAESPSLRSLCIDSPTVALADVVNPVEPISFRLTLVLRGRAKPGDVLTPRNLVADAVRTFDEVDVNGSGKPRPRRCEQALLFMNEAGNVRGLRLVTDDRRTMGLVNGKLVLLESRWPILVERVRADVATVDRLTAYRKNPVAEKRTRLLIEWMERHRDDLSTTPAGGDENPIGWDGLRVALFDAIYDTNDPACAWSAIRLHARLFGGELLKPRGEVFASPVGRSFLLREAGELSSLVGDRVRAVTLLGPCDELLLLLNDREVAVQTEVARTLNRNNSPKITEALLSAYREAKPGPFRDELAWALAGRAGAALEIPGGNPTGVCAVVRDMISYPDGIEFWIHLRSAGKTVNEPPVLVLERLNADGGVAETRRNPLVLGFVPRPWSEGWDGEGPLPATLPFQGLQPNTSYRFRVEGTLGPKKEKWVSEPRPFQTGPAIPGNEAPRRSNRAMWR